METTDGELIANDFYLHMQVCLVCPALVCVDTGIITMTPWLHGIAADIGSALINIQ